MSESRQQRRERERRERAEAAFRMGMRPDQARGAWVDPRVSPGFRDGGPGTLSIEIQPHRGDDRREATRRLHELARRDLGAVSCVGNGLSAGLVSALGQRGAYDFLRGLVEESGEPMLVAMGPAPTPPVVEDGVPTGLICALYPGAWDDTRGAAWLDATAREIDFTGWLRRTDGFQAVTVALISAGQPWPGGEEDDG
jgi:hypothetical protein